MKHHQNDKRGRRSIRLQHYDYTSSAAYFVTACSYRQSCLFGEVREHQMILSGIGRIVQRCWLTIPEHFPHVELDHYIVMPNHVHGILRIVRPSVHSSRVHNTETKVGAKDFSPLQGNGQANGMRNDDGTVGANNHSPIVESRRANRSRGEGCRPRESRACGTSKTIGSAIRGFKIGVTRWVRQNTRVYNVWQRNYYEHVIRNEESLMQIRQYIDENPLRWSDDPENPQTVNRRGE